MDLNLILGRTSVSRRNVGFAQRVSSKSGDLITYSREGHLMTFASTGKGKTSGPVISNALTHKGALIAIDIKGEIYAATAQARRDMGQEVHVLDLNDGGMPGSLNPLDLAMLGGTDIAAVARSLAAEMIERTGEERDRFWNDWAEIVLTGGFAHLLSDASEERRISWYFDLLSSDDVVYAMATLLDTKGDTMNRAAKAAMTSFMQLPHENTRGSVLGTAMTHLRLFDSDLTRRLTDTSSMDVARLVAGEPMSLYIIVPPMRLNAYKPLLRMWLSGLILGMTERDKAPVERTLLLCDEAGTIGRLDALLTAATLLRSYGLTIWTLWQNAGQLESYGKQANTLVDNAGVIQVLGANNLRMGQEFANIIGGVSGEQVLNMAPDEQMLLIDGKLTRCKQARYYNDLFFRGRAV